MRIYLAGTIVSVAAPSKKLSEQVAQLERDLMLRPRVPRRLLSYVLGPVWLDEYLALCRREGRL